MSYDNYAFDEQQVYISGEQLPGVESLSTTLEQPEDDLLSMGFTNVVGTAPDGFVNGEISVNRFLVTPRDTLTGCFENGVSGHVRYGEGAYIFQTGLISSYSCTCALNEVPNLDFSLSTWGKVGGASGIFQPGAETPHPEELVLPSDGDIEIQITDCEGGHAVDLTTNAVREFEYNIDIEWEPILTLGASEPQGFMVRYPIRVETIVTIELNDFLPPDFQEAVCQSINKKITLSVYNCSAQCGNERELVRTFRMPAGKLLEYNSFSDMDDVLVAELVFVSKVTSLAGLSSLF